MSNESRFTPSHAVAEGKKSTFLTPIIEQQIQHYVNQPDRGGKLSQSLMIALKSLPIADLNVLLPGYSEGKYFYASYQAYPQAWVPNVQLREKILYAGEGNLDGLRQRVYKRIHKLHEHFPEAIRPMTDEKGIPQNMNPHNIIRVLDFVEKFMAKADLRRTGEESFAHILRIVDRGMDYIQFLNGISRDGTLSLFFTPEVAEVFLMVLATHDFNEDKFKQKTENGNLIRQGDYEVHWQSGNPNVGILLSIKEYPEDKTIDDVDTKVVDSALIPMDPNYIPYYMDATAALNSNNFPEGKNIEGMNSITRKQADKLTLIFQSQRLLHYMAQIGKCFDRDDNMATSTFILENGIYKPRDPDRIYDKAKETLEQFPDAERYLIHASTEFFHESYLFKALGLENFYRHIALMRQYKVRSRFLPTESAKLWLLGVNPNKMYADDPAEKIAQYPRQVKPI